MMVWLSSQPAGFIRAPVGEGISNSRPVVRSATEVCQNPQTTFRPSGDSLGNHPLRMIEGRQIRDWLMLVLEDPEAVIALFDVQRIFPLEFLDGGLADEDGFAVPRGLEHFPALVEQRLDDGRGA